MSWLSRNLRIREPTASTPALSYEPPSMFTRSSSRPSIAPCWAPSHSRILPSPFIAIFLWSLVFIFVHDLIRKPVPTFRDHALSFFRIQSITQAVADQVERQHGQEDR